MSCVCGEQYEPGFFAGLTGKVSEFYSHTHSSNTHTAFLPVRGRAFARSLARGKGVVGVAPARVAGVDTMARGEIVAPGTG